MPQATVRLSIPFESLVKSVRELGLKEKRLLWELLNEQMSRVEEDLWEQDAVVRSEIREARAAYQAGDYVTIDEYIARRQGKA